MWIGGCYETLKHEIFNNEKRTASVSEQENIEIGEGKIGTKGNTPIQGSKGKYPIKNYWNSSPAGLITFR